jgi:hypothetical protein
VLTAITLLELLEVTELEERLLMLDELLETAVLEELLATTALLTDEAVLVGGVSGVFEPPPQPLSVRAKIRMLLGIKRDGVQVSKFMIPSTG